jgi:putative DNA-invertase from lambdoid prophage Rac
MILGYIRCSTADQAKDDRSSLQVQQDVIEGYARTRGIDRWGVQIYTDAGVSGATKLASRPAGEELLKAMSPGDTVIASKLDRMFRSAADALNMFEEFKARGVKLILFDISTESIFESAVAQLVVTILAAVAEMERVRIKERTAEGRKAKKAKGGLVGNVPFGYRKIGEGRAAVLEPDETEIKARHLMHELFNLPRRMGYTEISKQLAGHGFTSRAGRPFTAMAVRRVLLQEIAQ